MARFIARRLLGMIAVLFAIALLLHLSGLSLGPLDVTFFELAGLVAVALHLAGVGASFRGRVRR